MRKRNVATIGFLWLLVIICSTVCMHLDALPQHNCASYTEKVLCQRESSTYYIYVETCQFPLANFSCSCISPTTLSSETEKSYICEQLKNRSTNLLQLNALKFTNVISEERNIREKRQLKDSGLCKAITSPKPGKASCMITSQTVSCVGTCDQGYVFDGGQEEYTRTCNKAEGVWRPDAYFPECYRESFDSTCDPLCENGGNCIAFNLCSCSNEYRGNFCEYPIELCGLAKTDQPSSWQCNHTRSETTCDISCPSGYQGSRMTTKRYTCNVQGRWAAPGLPSCITALKNVEIQLKCENPVELENGKWQIVVGESLTPGSKIKYSCDSGYVLRGTPDAICNSDGAWTADSRQCVGDEVHYRCKDPGNIANGYRTDDSSDYLAGSYVSYECNEGYLMTGTSVLFCQLPGQWSTAKPFCFRDEPNRGSVPEPPRRGNVPEPPRRGSSPEPPRRGSVPEPPRRGSVPQPPRRGSVPEPPKRESVPEPPKRGNVPEQPQRGSIPEEPENESVQDAGYCPEPNVPKNAEVNVHFPQSSSSNRRFQVNSEHSYSESSGLPEGSFVVGTRVQYKCKSRFYKLYGSQYQTCLSSGTWSGYQPACVPDCGKSDLPRTPFIVNGNSSLIGQWPWQVGLGVREPQGYMEITCGGALVSEDWVLTAAHCVTKKFSSKPLAAATVIAYTGKYYRSFDKDDEYVQPKRVRQIIVHRDYDFIRFDSDIALLHLESSVTLTTRVQTICLPTEETTRNNVRNGKLGIVIGWGLKEDGKFSETLRETTMPVVSHDICESAYREGLRAVTVTENMFCAGYDTGASDTCNGDSGGPFMFGGPDNKKWFLEGLVSWGSESGCAKAMRYSGFTKVGRFVTWINMHI